MSATARFGVSLHESMSDLQERTDSVKKKRRLGAVWMLAIGAVLMLALQVLLVLGYLALSFNDPFLLDLPGGVNPNGIAMVMLCGKGMTPEGRGSEVLNNMPPDGDLGPWYRGRTVQGDCNIFYHYGIVNGHIVGD